jgi:predicted nucleic acid-binding protein
VKLRKLLDDHEEVAITGGILQEILQAFRDDETVSRVTQYLAPFPLLHLGREIYIEAARIHRRCAAKGIAASTIDCQIAAAVVSHGHLLLTADDDFARIAEVCDLELL